VLVHEHKATRVGVLSITMDFQGLSGAYRAVRCQPVFFRLQQHLDPPGDRRLAHRAYGRLSLAATSAPTTTSGGGWGADRLGGRGGARVAEARSPPVVRGQLLRGRRAARTPSRVLSRRTQCRSPVRRVPFLAAIACSPCPAHRPLPQLSPKLAEGVLSQVRWGAAYERGKV
jgi:hypothetical protein